MKNETVTISIELLNKVANYLGSRPFAEVYQLINALNEEIKATKEAE